MFDKFKSYIYDRIASINVESTQSLDKFTSPDSEAKLFKRKTESAKLKYKRNQKQFLFNNCIEDYSTYILELLKESKINEACNAVEKVKQTIQKRQKLIKLSDKSEGGWMVVAEYEQEELANDSDDKKRIRKEQDKDARKMKQLI